MLNLDNISTLIQKMKIYIQKALIYRLRKPLTLTYGASFLKKLSTKILTSISLLLAQIISIEGVTNGIGKVLNTFQ